jgi:hypothetical protein
MEQPTCSRVGDRTRHFPPIAEYDAQFLEILISEIGENGEVDAVLGEALRRPRSPTKGIPLLNHSRLAATVRFSMAGTMKTQPEMPANSRGPTLNCVYKTHFSNS